MSNLDDVMQDHAGCWAWHVGVARAELDFAGFAAWDRVPPRSCAVDFARLWLCGAAGEAHRRRGTCNHKLVISYTMVLLRELVPGSWSSARCILAILCRNFGVARAARRNGALADLKTERAVGRGHATDSC